MRPIDRNGAGHPRPVTVARWVGAAFATIANLVLVARRRMHAASKPATCGGLVLSVCLGANAAHADAALACNARGPDQVALHVSVSGMRSAKGNITITVYPDDAAHFLDGAYKVARQELPVTLPVTSACFVLVPGYYAVALFHDENGNHHLDTNSLGIPIEGYGFSNNPTLYFGPPALSRVRFSMPGDSSVVIRLKYP